MRFPGVRRARESEQRVAERLGRQERKRSRRKEGRKREEGMGKIAGGDLAQKGSKKKEKEHKRERDQLQISLLWVPCLF